MRHSSISEAGPEQSSKSLRGRAKVHCIPVLAKLLLLLFYPFRIIKVTIKTKVLIIIIKLITIIIIIMMIKNYIILIYS